MLNLMLLGNSSNKITSIFRSHFTSFKTLNLLEGINNLSDNLMSLSSNEKAELKVRPTVEIFSS